MKRHAKVKKFLAAIFVLVMMIHVFGTLLAGMHKEMATAHAAEPEPSEIVEVDRVDFYQNGYNRYLDTDARVRWYLDGTIDWDTTEWIYENTDWSDLTSINQTLKSQGVDPMYFNHYYGEFYRSLQQ